MRMSDDLFASHLPSDRKQYDLAQSGMQGPSHLFRATPERTIDFILVMAPSPRLFVAVDNEAALPKITYIHNS